MASDKSGTRSKPSSVGGNGMTPSLCPRCDWLGTQDQTVEGRKCPTCGTNVNTLRQKGLDNLRVHHRLLSKIGYKTALKLHERDEERDRVEQFFERIGAPL